MDNAALQKSYDAYLNKAGNGCWGPDAMQAAITAYLDHVGGVVAPREPTAEIISAMDNATGFDDLPFDDSNANEDRYRAAIIALQENSNDHPG